MRIETTLANLLASISWTRGRMLMLFVLCGVALAGIGASSAYGSVQSIVRASVDESGNEANGHIGESSISADGRYVAFESDSYIFVRDLQEGQIELVSVGASGEVANSSSSWPSISADGRYVAFQSNASNLVSGDTNSMRDVFVRDLQEGQTELVSVTDSGAAADGPSLAPSISADGRYVAFESFAFNLSLLECSKERAEQFQPCSAQASDVFVRDLQEGQTKLVSVTLYDTESDYSGKPSISADGRYVAFQSGSIELDPGLGCEYYPSGRTDIFLRDMQEGRTERVTPHCDVPRDVAMAGNQRSYSPSVSADGRYVAFKSDAFYHAYSQGYQDTNGVMDIFVSDMQEGRVERVSVDSSGNQANEASTDFSMSPDGRYVAFDSLASNLVPGDNNERFDVFVRDLQEGQTRRVSVGPYGSDSTYSSPLLIDLTGSQKPSISADGRYVAFESMASNLVAGDTNGSNDVFVRDMLYDTTAPSVPLITSPTEGARLNASSLTFSGTAEANAKVELFEGDVSKGEAIAGSDGKWSISLSGVSDGSHSFKAKATDEVGNTSAESEARMVRVDTIAPLVKSVVPQENATGTSLGTNVAAFFSETMRASSVKSAFKLYKKGSTTALEATVTYDATAKKAVLNPTANLQRGATYKAVVTTGAKDLAGNRLGRQKVWFFMTRL